MNSKAHRLPIVSDRSDMRSEAAPSRPGDSKPGAKPSEDVPEEELLQVGELAKKVGKTVRAIHHYENLGLLSPHKRSKGRYRLYAPDAIERVEWINKLHDLGMTLSQVQEILAHFEEAPSAPEAMAKIRSVYEQKLAEVRQQISHLTSLERELKTSLRYLDTCETTCRPQEIIEACASCTVHDEDAVEPPLITGLYAS